MRKEKDNYIKLMDTESLLNTVAHSKTHAFLLKEDTALYSLARMQSSAEIRHAFPAVTDKQADGLLAVLELARRINTAAAPCDKITSPKDLADLFREKLRYETQENFAVALLNTKNQVIRTLTIYKGTLNGTPVHPREVFRPAIVEHANSIAIAHNHPSGDPTPSKEDIALTELLVKTGDILKIPVVDHVIIADNRYCSFREKGLM